MRSLAEVLVRIVPGRRLATSEVLRGGSGDRNIILRFEDAENPLVLRIYRGDALAWAKEVNILRSASQLPVPEIVQASEDDEEIGPYLLYQYAEGVSFQELKSQGSREDVAEAAFAIGKALAGVKTVAPPENVPERTMGWQPGAVLEERMGARETEHLCAFLSHWSHRTRTLYAAGMLVHGDFNNRNTIVKRAAGHWEVSAVLDWELAFAGSPLWDAARFICYERKDRPCREPHFSNGYRAGGAELPEDWAGFSRAISALSAAESLSKPDVAPRFIPELKELISGIIA